MTALMWASYNGEADTARVLVEYGASLEAVDREGMTALMWASREGQEDTARVLVEHGAFVDAVELDGITAVLWASYEGHADTARVLVEHGAFLDAVDGEGNTALKFASDYGYRKVAKVLRKHGARGALCYAAKNDLRDMLAELISKGHGLEECDKDGKAALELAAGANNGKVVGLLMEAGIYAGQWQDVNACLGSAGKTLLMYASECEQQEPVRALIEKRRQSRGC
jgi:ankyrin repeat protein